MVHERIPQTVSIMGLVAKADKYELPKDEPLRVMQAIAMAGGRKLELANTVHVTRYVPGREQPIVIKVSIPKAKASRNADIVLAAGDVVSVEETPLAVCDAQTLRQDDFVPTDLRYPDRAGEVYSLYWRAEHRWFYYPDMRTDEALLLKCYDSDGARARFTAHTAFDDPTSADDANSRESIEVRTLAFFAS